MLLAIQGRVPCRLCRGLGARAQGTGGDHAGRSLSRSSAGPGYRERHHPDARGSSTGASTIPRTRSIVQQDLALRPFHDTNANQAILDFLRGWRQQAAVMPMFREASPAAARKPFRSCSTQETAREQGFVARACRKRGCCPTGKPFTKTRLLLAASVWMCAGALGRNVQRRRLSARRIVDGRERSDCVRGGRQGGPSGARDLRPGWLSVEHSANGKAGGVSAESDERFG